MLIRGGILLLKAVSGLNYQHLFRGLCKFRTGKTSRLRTEGVRRSIRRISAHSEEAGRILSAHEEVHDPEVQSRSEDSEG